MFSTCQFGGVEWFAYARSNIQSKHRVFHVCEMHTLRSFTKAFAMISHKRSHYSYLRLEVNNLPMKLESCRYFLRMKILVTKLFACMLLYEHHPTLMEVNNYWGTTCMRGYVSAINIILDDVRQVNELWHVNDMIGILLLL